MVQKCLREAERQTDEQIRLSTLYKAEKALMEDADDSIAASKRKPVTEPEPE